MVDSSESVVWNKDNPDVKNDDKFDKKSRVVGSRRIFSPVFKIQVLDSYRHDLDCRGNQRATARKYNIHRRQIQKWLQCEQQLRESIRNGKPTSQPFLNKKKELRWSTSEVGTTSFDNTRLSDAGVPTNRQTQVRETKVFDPVNNLKLVAQKLYPCSYNERIYTNLDNNYNIVNTNETNVVLLPSSVPKIKDICDKNNSTFDHTINQQFIVNNVGSHEKMSEDEGFTKMEASKYSRNDGDNFSPLVTGSESFSLVKQVPALNVYTDGQKFYNNSSPTYSTQDSSIPPRVSPTQPDEPKQENTKPPLISPKRKWIQESLSETQEEAKKLKTTVLPIKQRVKMLRNQAQKTKNDFSIDSLCSKASEQRETTTASFSQYDKPLIQDYSPPTYITPPFAPPLLFQHRVIPDLQSLHFKPDAPTDSELKLKEERLSDSEDSIDVDVTSTTPVDDKTFDFNTTKRRSFSVQFKLQVLDSFYNDETCNRNQRATARKYNINRRQVQKWLSQENELRNEGVTKSKENDDYCKQCPQHCKAEVHCKYEADKFTIKKEIDAITPSTKDIYKYPHEDLDKSSQNGGSYSYCSGYSDNFSVHFYPYHIVCDWSNYSYPCSLPLYQTNLSVV